jgi:Sap, sulfolipid-1-addressing protein
VARALADVIPLALGVALSPLPILAVLLMLLSRNELGNARAFLVGWTVTIAALAAAAVIASVDVHVSDPPQIFSVAEVATGVGLLAAAVIAWRRRAIAGRAHGEPRWLSVVDEISPLRACGLGIALVLLNAKDLALTVAAGTAISDAALPTASTVVALAVFTLIASSTIALPVAVAAVAGPRAEPTLRRWHGWLARNGTALLGVVLGIAGVLFVVAGLSL